MRRHRSPGVPNVLPIRNTGLHSVLRGRLQGDCVAWKMLRRWLPNPSFLLPWEEGYNHSLLRAYLILPMTITVSQTVATRIRVSTDMREGSILLKQKKGLTPTKLHVTPLWRVFCSLNAEIRLVTLLVCRYKAMLGHAPSVPLQNAYSTPYSLLWVRRLLFRQTTIHINPNVEACVQHIHEMCSTLVVMTFSHHDEKITSTKLYNLIQILVNGCLAKR